MMTPNQLRRRQSIGIGGRDAIGEGMEKRKSKKQEGGKGKRLRGRGLEVWTDRKM
jgi:hypothetical protein